MSAAAAANAPPVLSGLVAMFGILALFAGGALVRSGQPMADRPRWLRILAGSFLGVLGLFAMLVAFALGTCALITPH